MRAAVLSKSNTPWEIKDVDEPKPGAGQVVVRVHASGMCWSDVLAHRGQWPVQLPIVTGHEPAGEIVEVGAGVTSLDLVARGKVTPIIETYPLNQINTALARVESGEVRFRVVVQVQQS